MGRLLMLLGALIWEACNSSHTEAGSPRDMSVPQDAPMPPPPQDFYTPAEDLAYTPDLSQPDIAMPYCNKFQGPCDDGVDVYSAGCVVKNDRPLAEYELAVKIAMKNNPLRYFNGVSFYFKPGKCPPVPNDIVKNENFVLRYDQPLPNPMNGDVRFGIGAVGMRMPDPKYAGINCFVVQWESPCMDSRCLNPTATDYQEIICP